MNKIQIGQSLSDFLDEFYNWSQNTFGPGGNGKASALHLVKEAQEAADNPFDLEEWADCFMLTVDGARRSGYDFETLMTAVQHKFEICKTRKWLPPDENGVVEHDRSVT